MLQNDGRDQKVVWMHNYQRHEIRKREPAPIVASLADIDEATRTVQAAANAVLRLVFMARHRLGMPPLQ